MANGGKIVEVENIEKYNKFMINLFGKVTATNAEEGIKSMAGERERIRTTDSKTMMK